MPINIEICLILNDKLRFVVIAFPKEVNVAKSVYFIKNETLNHSFLYSLGVTPKQKTLLSLTSLRFWGRAFGYIFIFLKKKNKGYRRNPLRG
jgi:hypothetical protein